MEADQLFIAAVAAAGTHADILGKVSIIISAPPIITSQVATVLRYADAIGKLLQSVPHGFSPSAFVFGAVRVMITNAVKNMNSFLALSAQFDEVSRRLQCMGNLLPVTYPVRTMTSTLGRVMIGVIRFCGYATKYIKGISLQVWN
jgi:hypothetical protein